ncbi:hypothetical protein [Amycolatopsis magusensis]|uniref:Pycsar effector protein domain-containing protein n=1 Tax=Amycolatopsis magusensis TaxID=882444 RepID=A0ABS4PYR7_9PSEU|nr:hypothetical protein [Amycolatopsis magusensis]MBP2184574.1 hypothetical protein [Amycolatopsis magusensis]
MRTARDGSETELSTALHTIAFFQGLVQHADEKARTVVAVQTMIAALVTAQLGMLGKPPTGAVSRLVILSILVCFAIAYVHSSFHLVQAIRPRTAAPSGDNRFAFPSVAAGSADLVHVPLRKQCAQAHDVIRLLAVLAMRKHRHVRSALAGTCALFPAGLGLMFTAAFP